MRFLRLVGFAGYLAGMLVVSANAQPLEKLDSTVHRLKAIEAQVTRQADQLNETIQQSTQLDERYTYFQQRNSGQPAVVNSKYEKLYQVEQENRAMQIWVAGILSSPFVAIAVAESGALYGTGQLVSYSGRVLMRLGQWSLTSPAKLGASNLMSGAADASFQLVANNGDLSQVNWASVGFNTLAKGGLLKSSVIAGIGSSTLSVTLSDGPTLSNPVSLKGAFNVAGNMAGGFLGKSFGADLPLGRTIGGSCFYNFVGNFGGNVIGNFPETIQGTKK